MELDARCMNTALHLRCRAVFMRRASSSIRCSRDKPISRYVFVCNTVGTFGPQDFHTAIYVHVHSVFHMLPMVKCMKSAHGSVPQNYSVSKLSQHLDAKYRSGRVNMTSAIFQPSLVDLCTVLF